MVRNDSDFLGKLGTMMESIIKDDYFHLTLKGIAILEEKK